jgi:WD40 repeat protein
MTTRLALVLLLLPVAAAPAPAQPPRADDPLPPGAVARLGAWRPRLDEGVGSNAVFAPDGRWFVTTALGGAPVHLWDTATVREVRRLEAPAPGSLIPTPGGGLAVSPDGKWLAAGVATPDGDNRLYVWDAGSGKLLPAFSGQHGGILGVAFHSDGKTLVTLRGVGGIDRSGGTIDWWDLATGKRRSGWDPFAPWRGKGPWQLDDVFDLTLSPDGKKLAARVGWRPPDAPPNSGPGKYSVVLFDLEARKELGRVKFKGYSRGPMAFSPDGSRLAFNWNQYDLFVLDAATAKPVRRIKLPQAAVSTGHGLLDTISGLTFAPDGRTLAVLLPGVGVQTWDLTTGKKARTLRVPAAWRDLPGRGAASVAWSPDGKRIVAASSRSLWLWDAATGAELTRTAGHPYPVTFLEFAADGKQLQSSARVPGMWRDWHEDITWDAVTWKPAQRRERDIWPGEHVTSRDFRVFVKRDQEEGDLFVWDRAGARAMCRVGRNSEFFKLGGLFSPSNRLVLVGGLDGAKGPVLFDATTGKRRGELPENYGFGVFAARDEALAFFDQQGGVHLFDVAAGKTAWSWAPAKGSGAADRKPAIVLGAATLTFSADGRYLASWQHGDDVRVWDVRTGKLYRRLPVAALETGPLPYTPLAFSPDSRTLAVGGLIDVPGVVVYELATARVRLCLDGHRGPVTALAFSPDGRLLASGSEDTTILVWDLLAPAAR